MRWLVGIFSLLLACERPAAVSSDQPAISGDRAQTASLPSTTRRGPKVTEQRHPDGTSTAPVQAGRAQKQRSFLWRVRSETATVYLLGSIHVAKRELYPLRPVIEQAFDKSDVLVLEVLLDESSRLDLQKEALARASYPEGDSLEAHLEPQTLSLLEQYVKTHNNRLPVYRLRPWFLTTNIMLAELARRGYQSEYGIDSHFQRQALADNKPILALESAKAQLELLSGLSGKVQDLMLRQTLESLSELDHMMDNAFEAWSSGDARALADALLASISEPEYQPVYEKVFLERNRKMAGRIEEYLATQKSYFVVVGSGHLVGRQGLVDLLRKRRPEQL